MLAVGDKLNKLNKCLFSKDDIKSLYGTPVAPVPPVGLPQNFLHELPAPVQTKLDAARPLLASSHEIKKGLYDDIYITSDIHTDLKKLNYLLNGAGLVSSNGIVEEDDIMTGIADSGTLDWVPEKTLLIIVGDVVDGVRRNIDTRSHQIVFDQQHQDDSKGNIELLLLAYLYNLRIKARAKKSEIIFTVGNHDYQTVVTDPRTNPYYNNGYMYKSYVHAGAQKFFEEERFRRACLLPFFNVCPYVIVKVADEVICVHGGFHTPDYTGRVVDLTDNFIDAQKAIDAVGSFNGITGATDILLSNSGNHPLSALWSRFYAESAPDTACAPVYRMPYKMVVVGHCPTDFATHRHLRYIRSTDINYKGHNCDKGGCVLVGCKTPQGPHLAFVDIGMSACFRRPIGAHILAAATEWTNETAQRAEILHLTHKNHLSVKNRYYNSILREKISGVGGKETIEVWKDKAPNNAFNKLLKEPQDPRVPLLGTHNVFENAEPRPENVPLPKLGQVDGGRRRSKRVRRQKKNKSRRRSKF